MASTKRQVAFSNVTQAMIDVIDERKRQQATKERRRFNEKAGEGYSPDFDDDVNDDREMAAAAAAYAFGAQYDDYSRKSQTNQDSAGRPTRIYDMWPASWNWDQYKPTTSRRDLVKAAALCIAEIERLDRKVVRDELEALATAALEASMEREYGTKN